MGVSINDLGRTILPLRLIFWGGLLCVLDFTISSTTNGNGWKFDFLNDFVGMLMIAWATFQLATVAVHERYQKWMLFIKVVATLCCVEAFLDHFIIDFPMPIYLAFMLLGLAAMLAIVMFCVSMRWLSEEARLSRSAKSWKVSTILFVIIYLIPLGLFYCAAAIAIASGSSFNIDLGVGGVLLIPVFLIPIVHLFISTSRMKNEGSQMIDSGEDETPLQDDFVAPPAY